MGGIPRRDQQPVSPITDHDNAYNHHHLGESSTSHRGTLPPDPNTNLSGTADKGSHSAVFGLTPTGERHLDTSPAHPGQTTFSDSSVSNLTSSSGGTETYHPPRGQAVRFDSSTAPETLTGNVEHVPTLPSQRPPEVPTNHTTTTPAVGTGEHGTTIESGVKKQGTLSKLFKRKPVGGTEQPSPRDPSAERKKFY